jgi:hypothetical protein
LNIGGGAVNLSIEEQSRRALVVRLAGIVVNPRMEGGHRRHDLNQQEDAEGQGSAAAFHGAHEPFMRCRHHDCQYDTGGGVWQGEILRSK